jgi:hypothetical protein
MDTMGVVQLFEPIVPLSQQHQNFRQLLTEANGYKMDVLTDWARDFVDRDGKFVSEFQTSFDPCFWELYLHAMLKAYGMKPDFSRAAPDFVLPSENFTIEAVTATHAANKAPEYQKTAANIRCSNSLTSKHRKYLESYANQAHVTGRPFVLAFASFDQPHSYMECQRAIEAVLHAYYVDEDSYNASGAKVRIEGEELLKVFKDNGSPIELGLFETPAFKEISAVIFNSCATMGKVHALSSDPNPYIIFTALKQNSLSINPTVVRQTKANYMEHLLDGLRIYHNPYATHPLDPTSFRNPRVFQTFGQGSNAVCEQRDGNLLFRTVVAVKVRTDARPVVAGGEA